MIKLKPFKQSRGYCGPASLKMILSFYGINKSEKELAKLTKASRDKGCSEIDIVKIAKKFGFKAHIKKNSSIIELKELTMKGIPVVVDWFSPLENGHYSVVVGFERDKIIIADPLFGKTMKHKIKWFEDRWFDTPFEKVTKKEVIVIER